MEKNIKKDKPFKEKELEQNEYYEEEYDTDDNNNYEDIHDYKQTISSYYKRTEKGDWFYPDDDEDEFGYQESDEEE